LKLSRNSDRDKKLSKRQVALFLEIHCHLSQTDGNSQNNSAKQKVFFKHFANKLCEESFHLHAWGSRPGETRPLNFEPIHLVRTIAHDIEATIRRTEAYNVINKYLTGTPLGRLQIKHQIVSKDY